MSWTGQSWGPEQPRFVADLTGDGRADLVGFGQDGVWASLNNGDGTFQPPNMVLCAFGFHTGWTIERHLRFLVDVTGDGRADIVGFGDEGVWTARNNGDGTFQQMKFVIREMGWDRGWRVDQHPRFVADVTGDGKADLVGFGQGGVWVALGNGDGTFQAPSLALNALGADDGWRVDQHPRFVADVTGDGKADLVGYRDDGVWLALSNGDGTFQPPQRILADFDKAHGWLADKDLRITGDLTGDGRADLIGFGDAQVSAAISNGNGTFATPTPIATKMGFNDGWRVDKDPRFAADLTGDGRSDLIGFANDGVWTSVTGGSGAKPVLAEFGFNKGWRVPLHPRFLADLTGDHKADIVGFGTGGVWVALSNGDGTFQPAGLVLPDFGLHAGPVVQSITIDFHTDDDDLGKESRLDVFVKNRRSDSSDSPGASTFVANLQDYQDHDADWFDRNPYLGCALNATKGQGFGDHSTNPVAIQLRSQPIPVEELLLPAVDIHFLAEHNDRWKFDYTLTITLDDGMVLPPFTSNANGLNGIVLDQDNRNYYGICSEVRPIPPRTKPVTDSVLTNATIEFHTHDDDKNSDTTLSIHIINRISATESQDISVATDVAKGQKFGDDTGDVEKSYNRINLPPPASTVFLRDMVLPVVFINIAAGTDQWIFDYRVTLFFGEDEPYSWTVSGVILDQDHHKHMGVYNGRPFPTLFRPQPPLIATPRIKTKHIPLAFVGQKLQEIVNSRQVVKSPDPLIKLTLSSPQFTGGPNPPTFLDLQVIENDPPPPDGEPLSPGFHMGWTYSHHIADEGQQGWLGFGVHLNDIKNESLSLTVDPDNEGAPLTFKVQFETTGPTEITGVKDLDVVQFEITILLTLRYHEPTRAVDLMGWMDDINSVAYTAQAFGPVKVSGSFLGQPLRDVTASPADYRDHLIGRVVDVVFTLGGSPLDPGGVIQKRIRNRIWDSLSSKDGITKVTPRESMNATLNSWLMGGVIASGNPELQPYPNPCSLQAAEVKNGFLSLTYALPEKSFATPPPSNWPTTLAPGNLANIDHIVVLTQENRSFDHMLGYLSLPVEKGGMNRKDVDGLKGGEVNMYNGRKIHSFRLEAGDTIFSPGPPNDPERVRDQINGGRMDGFVQAQAYEFGPATAHRVMGYHTADNVPTYDSLARDFAICHRWFAPHPGPTFPNRFYELTGRPNIDPWGAWEYSNTSPFRPALTRTIFDELTDRDISWAYFEHFYSFLRYFEEYTYDSENLVSYNDPVRGFAARSNSGTLPSVSFIDPHYVDYPPNSFCDEPPSDLRNSQPFIRSLVETLVASPKWEKTLLIITYDEHGGFYDHVPPVPAAKVSPEMLPTTGMRVPCFVVSPWVKGGTAFGSNNLHFDHTSILKTIARRFMSNNPPYMGARYAEAHDLSEILAAQLRPARFRPFIPYTLVYVSSNMRLNVPGASTAIGTALSGSPPDKTAEEQKFRFEDADDGFVYIRTLAGLYVTVDAPSGIPTQPGATLGIKQDVKYAPGSTGPHNPDLQRWKFASSAIVAIHPTNCTISCAAVPGKVLQPVNNGTAPGTGVVLANPGPHTAVSIPNPWDVTSPLLGPTAIAHG